MREFESIFVPLMRPEPVGSEPGGLDLGFCQARLSACGSANQDVTEWLRSCESSKIRLLSHC